MRRLAVIFFAFTLCGSALAQVDVEHRRTLTLQTGFAVSQSEEALGGFGYFWFNENNYPWTNTALRVIFSGVFVDTELSYFLPARTNTAVGIGGGGGFYIESVTPYEKGERLSQSQFYGDVADIRFFINQTIPNPTPLPVNVRATYILSGAFYRKADTTRNFTMPDDFLTQTALAELRLGGIEPGLTAKRGAELYVAADANYRSGFDAFGPNGALFPAHNEYERLFASLGGKIPIAGTVLFPRIAGGLGDHLDELSSWKIGGNLVGVEPYGYTVHGYYTREFFASDFGLANVDWAIPILDERKVIGHLYGDWAVVKPVPPQPSDWHNYFGVGAGVDFRAWWEFDLLLSYGYGFNAVRNGDNGGHEVGLALEKKF
jgi:hypothetical protein